MMQHNNAAIYCRLSKEDKARDGHIAVTDNSESIESQKMMLERYANENGLYVVDYYIDDGYSGAKDFGTRPDFVRMLEDIDAGKVNVVLCKDLSRLGRNYIEVGRYQEEIFPSLGVRLIAPNDSYDSEQGENEMAPLRNMFNDFYARDTSKKVRKALAARAQSGKYIGRGVYGYQKDPQDRHRLIPDPATAPVVRRIFDMAASGNGYGKIARTLQAEGVPTPAEVKGKGAKQPYYQPHSWHMSTVRVILNNPVYLGHLVQLKTTVQSYRVNKILPNDSDKWAVVEQTHEPLITQTTWDTVQAVASTHRKVCKNGEPHIFAGLLKCGTCGAPLAKESGTHDAFSCSIYKRQGKQYCTSHRILMPNLSAVVLNRIQAVTTRVRKNRDEFIAELSGVNAAEVRRKKDALAKEITIKKNRLNKLGGLIRKVFEQNADGILPDDTYRQMLADYNREQSDLTGQLSQLEEQLAELEQGANNVTGFMDIIDQYIDIEELDSSIVHELIERIEVHQAERRDGMKHQQVDITFRLLGKL